MDAELDWYRSSQKDYGLYVVRTCVLLNSGALVAILGLLSNIGQDIPLLRNVLPGFINASEFWIAGVALGMAAAACGYFNFTGLGYLSVNGHTNGDWRTRLWARIVWWTFFTAPPLVIASIVCLLLGARLAVKAFSTPVGG